VTSSPVTVGFIGAGNVLPAYLQVLDRLIPRGLAREGPIQARTPVSRDAVLALRPGARVVSDPREVVEASDLVCVLTPPHPRPALVELALRAGCHVVAEKPLAMSRAEAEPLVLLAAERDLHLLIAPFVQLSPTMRELWARVADGAIGAVHSARAMYGNPGSPWAPWFHAGGVGAMAECGIYNLKSLTCLLGPVAEVLAADAVAVERRVAGGVAIDDPDADVTQAILRHASGALSSVLASQAIHIYRRPGIELYGTEGSANLLGDDWDPQGIELWREATGTWELIDPPDSTWLWADGLREGVLAAAGVRAPLAQAAQDLHLLDVIDAARTSARERAWVSVASAFQPSDLRPAPLTAAHGHDRTRPLDEQ